MCGIVGILGSKPVATDLVDALRRLEYRGYDSAGVATVENGHLERRRAEGKLRNLEQRLAREPLQGHTGIGHTRWATHGRPTENNAHPHMSKGVSVVHNGIIENFGDLRRMLTARGHHFETETDTEVVVHLITDALHDGLPPVEATKKALGQLKGAFALAIIFAGHDDLMIAARQGSPLAIGHGKGEMYLGSDAIALAPFTNEITYLDEGDWAVLTRSGATIFDSEGRKVERPRIRSSAGSMLIDKGNHRHFMAKEIHEQPDVISRTLANYVNFAEGRVELPELGINPASITQVSISACGTAYYAGLVKNGSGRSAEHPPTSAQAATASNPPTAANWRSNVAPRGSSRALSLPRLAANLAATRSEAAGSSIAPLASDQMTKARWVRSSR